MLGNATHLPDRGRGRASEARFRELQAACDAGQVPELRKGDVIYIGTELYISHGCDDFRGGLAEVIETRQEKSKGLLTPFVRVVQQPDSLHNWKMLAEEQSTLRGRHGTIGRIQTRTTGRSLMDTASRTERKIGGSDHREIGPALGFRSPITRSPDHRSATC